MAFPVGAAMLGGSALLSLLNKGKGTKIEQGPLETPEQAEARKRLLALAKTDPSYKGSLGDFKMTDTEEAGSARLMALLDRGTPDVALAGADTLESFLTDEKYDPETDGEYQGFARQNRVNTDESVRNLKRRASFAKNLYSSDTMENLGDIEAASNINLQNKLAELNDKYVARKLSAAPYALQAGQTLQGMDLNAINAAYTYGSLPRTLSTAADQAAYGEFVRSQGVTDQRLGTVAGGAPPFGVSSYTLPSDGGAWGKVTDMLAYGGGMLLARGGGAPAAPGVESGGMFATNPNLNLYQPWEQPFMGGY